MDSFLIQRSKMGLDIGSVMTAKGCHSKIQPQQSVIRTECSYVVMLVTRAEIDKTFK